MLSGRSSHPLPVLSIILQVCAAFGLKVAHIQSLRSHFHTLTMEVFAVILIVSASVVIGVRLPSEPKLKCWDIGFQVSHTPPTEPCFRGHTCKCSNTTVDCSSNFGNLTFVPELRRSYQVLNFSYNNVGYISGRNFFVNVSREVRVIDLYHNRLVHLPSGLFEGLSKLTTLVLGGFNHLGYKDVQPLLSIPSLVQLVMGCLHLGPIPGQAFRDGNGSKLSSIDLTRNDISRLNMSVFQPLQNLKRITLGNNQLYELETARLPSIEMLNMHTNRLYQFPKTCSKTGASLFPSLKHLTLDQNMIECIGDRVCLPSLDALFLRYNNFKYFTTDTFSDTRFPSLKLLNIMQMENKIFRMESFFINNSAVTSIFFDFNKVDFSTAVVHEEAFEGCTNVNVISLRGNVFRDVPDERFHGIFKPMQKTLEILNLSSAEITQISRSTFSKLKNLRQIYLFDNSLTVIPDGAFDDHFQMTQLWISGNNIASISEATFTASLRSR